MWLSTFDFVIIAAVLLITLSIGMYFGCAGGGPQTTDEFLQAGRNMGVLPVSLSLMATYISTATLMGIPAEIYMFGTPMAFLIVGIVLGMLAATFVFLPVYFSAQVSTSYEYLEKRFGSIARTVCSLGYVIQAILFMSVILYTPALALSAVTDLQTSTSVMTIGGICTLYCTLGGMKAVLWTDVFQSLLMFVCLFSIVTKGIVDIGFLEIFRICEEGGRLITPSFSANISLKYTGWSIIIMGFTMSTFTFGTSQLQVQRLLTVKNCRKSQLSLLASIPFTTTFYLLCCFCGLVFYATYWNCDPLSSPKKIVSSGDQIMPYYIMKNLGQYPGLAGLCVCGIFGASLSTVSSSIHTLTVVTMKDFLQPFFQNCGVSARNSALPKALTVMYGVTGVWLSFVVAKWGNIIIATILLFNLSGGPLLGLFFLGVLTTSANEKGVVIGIITSFVLSVWLSFGPFSSIHKELTFSTEGCEDFNYFLTESPLNSTLSLKDNLNEDKFLMSFMWVTPIAMVSCVVIGYVFSVVINFFTGEEKHIPPEYSSPIFLWFRRTLFKDAQSIDKDVVKEKLQAQTRL